MKREPLISVIVPIYNVEEYLEECISSIVQQTYQNLQIILVDDGSTDGSGKICDDFAKIDGRIEVMHKENGGLVHTRKMGLSIAKGEYIGFVDGDDWINRNMYEGMMENLMLTGADFVHTGYQKGVMEKSKLKNTLMDISKRKSEFINHYVLSSSGEENVSPSIWSKLFKAELIKKSYDEVPEFQSLGEDLINLLVCIIYSNKVSCMNSSYYHYRVRDTSMTHAKTGTVLLQWIRLCQEIENVLKKYGYYDRVKEAFTKDWLGVTLCNALVQASEDEFRIQCYGMSNIQMLFDKKIVLYGAGRIGKDYYSQLSRYARCRLAAWIDINYQNIHYDCAEIADPELLKTLDFDRLVVAVKEQNVAERIMNTLVEDYKIEKEKMVWIKPEFNYTNN